MRFAFTHLVNVTVGCVCARAHALRLPVCLSWIGCVLHSYWFAVAHLPSWFVHFYVWLVGFAVSPLWITQLVCVLLVCVHCGLLHAPVVTFAFCTPSSVVTPVVLHPVRLVCVWFVVVGSCFTFHFHFCVLRFFYPVTLLVWFGWFTLFFAFAFCVGLFYLPVIAF